jgi:stress response protein SCP2
VWVDPVMLEVALPLSGKGVSSGLGVLPRGSVSAVEGRLLRFFMYWRQTRHETDFDLSAQLLDEEYRTVSWLDWTALTDVGGAHSGDITDAPDGATEFIDLDLSAVRGAYIVPLVNVYSGERFGEVAESFFGFMTRDAEQAGRPFEPRTVRMKSELRGPGRVALPLVFARGEDGGWHARWMHVHLRGAPAYNQVARHHLSVSTLVRGAVEGRFLTVEYLTGLLADNGATVRVWDGTTTPPEGPVTFLGLERPEGLHPQARVVTPENLRDLIPE